MSIAALVAEARSNQSVAHLLSLQESSVREYLSVIYKKLSLPNRTALALWYWERFGLPTTNQIKEY